MENNDDSKQRTARHPTADPVVHVLPGRDGHDLRRAGHGHRSARVPGPRPLLRRQPLRLDLADHRDACRACCRLCPRRHPFRPKGRSRLSLRHHSRGGHSGAGHSRHEGNRAEGLSPARAAHGRSRQRAAAVRPVAVSSRVRISLYRQNSRKGNEQHRQDGRPVLCPFHTGQFCRHGPDRVRPDRLSRREPDI